MLTSSCLAVGSKIADLMSNLQRVENTIIIRRDQYIISHLCVGLPSSSVSSPSFTDAGSWRQIIGCCFEYSADTSSAATNHYSHLGSPRIFLLGSSQFAAPEKFLRGDRRHPRVWVWKRIYIQQILSIIQSTMLTTEIWLNVWVVQLFMV